MLHISHMIRGPRCDMRQWRQSRRSFLWFLFWTGCGPDGMTSLADDPSHGQQALATVAYQIDCGGSAAAPFTADQFFAGGSTYVSNAAIAVAGVANAAPAAVYQSERFGAHSYTFKNLAPSGAYTV